MIAARGHLRLFMWVLVAVAGVTAVGLATATSHLPRGVKATYDYDASLNNAYAHRVAEPMSTAAARPEGTRASEHVHAVSTLIAPVVAAETEGALAAEARGGVYTLRDEAGAVGGVHPVV